ncbi:hypothetical protein ACFC1R_23890 [Kitasatospora sp. NPDC056138]|uniref:hypothetical protein n=1 Tax=Kitasatospora sp. NPDC056138 TaxID=3345724 RepID=UPI0035D61200
MLEDAVPGVAIALWSIPGMPGIPECSECEDEPHARSATASRAVAPAVTAQPREIERGEADISRSFLYERAEKGAWMSR